MISNYLMKCLFGRHDFCLSPSFTMLIPYAGNRHSSAECTSTCKVWFSTFLPVLDALSTQFVSYLGVISFVVGEF